MKKNLFIQTITIKRRIKIKRVICPTCNSLARLTKGSEIHPHLNHLANSNFYICDPCEAYVGCHRHTDVPLGTLANKELRYARAELHKLIDPLWKRHGDMRLHRKKVYQYMAMILNQEYNDTHIGLFTLEDCQKITKAMEGMKYSKIEKALKNVQ